MTRVKKVTSRIAKPGQTEVSTLGMAVEEVMKTPLVPLAPIFSEVHFQEWFS